MTANFNPSVVLYEINESIACREKELNAKFTIIENLKSRLEKELKKDELFKLLFQRFHNTGSFYDGLACSDGSDYDLDLNLILSIEELLPVLRFFENKEASGFLRLNLKTGGHLKSEPNWEVKWSRFLDQLTSCDADTKCQWVDPSLLRRWFKTIVSNLDMGNLKGDDIMDVKVSSAGPAMKLTISAKSLPDSIDVDLVPVFQFLPEVLFYVPEDHKFHDLVYSGERIGRPEIKSFFDRCFLEFSIGMTKSASNRLDMELRPEEKFFLVLEDMEIMVKGGCQIKADQKKALEEFEIIYDVLSDNDGLKEPFFLVPKALKNINMADADKMWRMDFHNVEMKILTGYPKKIVCLLKTFRNGNADNMSELSSYLLKTIVMLLVKERPDLTWSEVFSEILFLETLKKLQNYLQEKKVPFYFHPGCNILWDMDQAQIAKMAIWLATSIRKMENSMWTDNCRTVWRQQFGLEPISQLRSNFFRYLSSLFPNSFSLQ
jgi:hypothetical protein